jgi:hypothetical protein
VLVLVEDLADESHVCGSLVDVFGCWVAKFIKPCGTKISYRGDVFVER